MPNTIQIHRVLRAEPEKVYRAFLDPEAMAKRPEDRGQRSEVVSLFWRDARFLRGIARFGLVRHANGMFQVNARLEYEGLLPGISQKAEGRGKMAEDERERLRLP